MGWLVWAGGKRWSGESEEHNAASDHIQRDTSATNKTIKYEMDKMCDNNVQHVQPRMMRINASKMSHRMNHNMTRTT
eukprot:8131282-Karenia_brevis.AAC.1